MKHLWPVPESYSRIVPQDSEPGAFWCHRGDRYHCGVDLYSPEHAPVLSIERGRVVEVGPFTSPEGNPYWNHTHFALVELPSGHLVKYAELGSIRVEKGEWVLAGQTLGTVGQVISPERVDDSAPSYIQELVREHLTSMLHLEVFLPKLEMPDEYRGGNLFSPECPEGLLDPSMLLAAVDEVET